MQSLNLGILAHVDAGKTTLSERLLYAAGAIDQLGSVDKGNTQTDTLALERQRRITIRSAVASFVADGVSVNLIDTPGHPDFIAEVERVLRVLDGAVLVISAVEGVQSQTRVLMKALKRLAIPTLLFVNKIDRAGAREGPLLREISQKLELAIVPMGSTAALGTREADFTPSDESELEHHSLLIEAAVDYGAAKLTDHVDKKDGPPIDRLQRRLKSQIEQGLVHPLFYGSARSGAGITPLMSGIANLLLVRASADPDAQVSGTVFKIERGAKREKIAYIRLFAGTVRLRDRLMYGSGHSDKVTKITPFGPASERAVASVWPGDIAKVWGLHHVQVGDRIGQVGTEDVVWQFAPPTMESVVEACHLADRTRLHTALEELTEQDPFIGVRHDDTLNETTVLLYGEVQREVMQSTLEHDYGVDAKFRPATTICIERPTRSGEALALLTSDVNPYMATIGLRIEPGPVASGVRLRLDVNPRSLPLFIYKSEGRFIESMTQYIRIALEQGRYGWEVTDCLVTLNRCDYYIGDGPTKPTVSMARTTSADFRKLTPVVLKRALVQAGTFVCEPMMKLSIETPTDAMAGLLNALAQLGGVVEQTSVRSSFSTIEAEMSGDGWSELRRHLPRLTHGEGNAETILAGYRRVRGRPPRRSNNTGK